MKYVITLLVLLVPSVGLAWSNPVLDNICGDFSITLKKESNQVIEFSDDGFKTLIETRDFVKEGKYDLDYNSNTLYARYKSDRKAKSSSQKKSCQEVQNDEIVDKPKEKKGKTRKRKHGYIRKWVAPAPVVLPVFDLPLFDYPVEIKASVNDKG